LPAILDNAAKWQPDAVLLDGLYGAPVAQAVCNELKVPLLYRSHNVEHVYMRLQFQRQGKLLARAGLIANLIGLEAYERKVVASAQRVFDISDEDRAYWLGQGHNHVEWVPPIVDEEFTAKLGTRTPPRFDVLFFGNLNTPNNVEGVRWLIEQVLQRVRSPSLRIGVVGSRPVNELRRSVEGDPRIELIENPVDIASLAASAKVLVNPVRVSSGVNLKSVEMLFTRAALVSTPAGVAGLPADIKNCFCIADTPQEFADALQIAVATNPTDQQLEKRRIVSKVFTDGQYSVRVRDAITARCVGKK
jgi:hypothetical protein